MKWLLFIPLFLFGMPKWYYNIESNNSDIIIGYGSGKSEKEAKNNALNDIVSQIAVTIKNEIQKTQSLNNNNYNKNIKINSYQKSIATLYGYKVIKLEYENKRFFVAIEYENIPSIDKFAKKTKLKKDFIIKAIKRDFGLKEGIELVRKDKKWFIKYKDIMQILDKRDFERFFATIPNNTLSIYINKNNILHYNQSFKIKIKSTKKGYITIFDIYDNGTVAILAKNIPIKNSITFPNEEYDLVADNKDTIDLYVVIRSNKKLILDDFAMADEEFITDERYKNFDELLRFIKDKTFTSLRVVTKGNR